MTAAARSAVKRLLYDAGFYRWRLRSVTLPGLLVLGYHGIRSREAERVPFAGLHVTEAQFAAHCELLATSCRPVTLDEVCDAVAGGRPLPPRAVLVTFDDGYRSVLTRGLPILRRYRVPAAAFVCTGPIERQQMLWYDALAHRDGEDAVEQAKRLPYAQWVETVGAAAASAVPGDPHSPMTVDELRELAADPLIAVGAHTESHPILARAPETVQRDEVHGSRARLSSWLDRPVRAFAYPNGRPGIDYDARTVAAVKDAGFTMAFTTAPGCFGAADSPLECPRMVVVDGMSASNLAHALAFTWAS